MVWRSHWTSRAALQRWPGFTLLGRAGMRAVLVTAAVAAVLATGGAASVTAAPTGAASAITPEKAADFQLTDTTRMAHRLSYYVYAPAIVLMSQKVGGPVSRA